MAEENYSEDYQSLQGSLKNGANIGALSQSETMSSRPLGTKLISTESPIVDSESQYKIAKKKELLLKKIEQLRTNKDGMETQQVMID